MTRSLLYVAVIVLYASCNAPRTLYISNKLGDDITFLIDSTKIKNAVTRRVAFADSLNGRRLKPGHLIINFGPGRVEAAGQGIPPGSIEGHHNSF